MKLTVYVITVLLLVCSLSVCPSTLSSARTLRLQQPSSPQVKPPATQTKKTQTVPELQEKLKLVDSLDNIDVDLTAPTESSGKLTILAEGTALGGEDGFFTIDLGLLVITQSFITETIIKIFSRTTNVGSLKSVKVQQIGATADYEVVEDYTYESSGYKITVPKGFVYDRASIPGIFWVVIDKDSLSNVAPLFHDFLYRYGGKPETKYVVPYRTFTREQTDNLFAELMTKSGVVEWRRKAAYKAVRNFSGPYWNGK